MSQELLVIGTFADADSAQEALDTMRQQIAGLQHHNIAILHHAENGTVEIRETAEAQAARRDTTIGAVAGWLLGFANALAGAGVGPAEGGPIGQALGQQFAADEDSGFSDPFLREIAASLQQGFTGLLFIGNEAEASSATAVLQQHGASVTAREVTPALRARLTA